MAKNNAKSVAGAFRQWIIVGCLAITLAGCTALVRPNFEAEVVNLREGQYELDPRHSFVHFKVPHLGLSTYVGRFNEFDATMDFDPDNISATRLEGTVTLASVDTGDEEVDELLREPAWFDVAQFPQAVFKTTAVTALAGNALEINGELTIRGVTRALTLQGRFNGGADNLLTRRYTIGFSARGTFSRSDYGIDRFAGLVGNDVEIELFAEFLRNQ